MVYLKDEIEFTSLDDFYTKIELVNAFKTTAISYRIKDLIEDNKDNQEKLFFEMEAFHFVLSDGRANGYSKNIKPDGVSIYEYPDATELSKDALIYYLERSKNTLNNSLKIRYLQILVSSEQAEYLQLCFKDLVDSYLLEIENYLPSKTLSENAYDIWVLFKCAFLLAKKTKYKTEIAAKLCVDFFLSKDYPKSAKYKLLAIIIENKKYYTADQLDSFYSSTIELSDTAPYCTDCFAMEKLLSVAKKLAQIIGKPFKEWHEKLAVTYEKEMQNRKDDSSNMMPMHWCEKAIEQYQFSGNNVKIKELHVKYAEYRKDFKLDTFSTELDKNEMTEWYDYLDKKAKNLIARNDPQTLLNYLSQGNDIFPNITWLQEYAKKKDESFFDSMSISKADTNKNFSKKIITEDDHNWHKIFESYQYYLDFSVLPFLRRFFYFGFIKQKVCFNTITKYLQSNSWIGNTLASRDSGGNKILYNWLSLIAPALYNFHSNFEAFLTAKNKTINIVLPVDSLVLKFEGLFRDFARLLALPTTVLAKGNMREMYIEELLEIEEMKKYFDENDMLLFRYIFVSKNGLNLRNNIAHSFLQFNDYRIEYMLLLIMALLRLGKYTVDTSKQTL